MNISRKQLSEWAERAKKGVKKWYLVHLARQYYIRYHDILDRYDCGISMADNVSRGELSKYKRLFNDTMDKLTIIDESTPKSRL